MARRGGRPGAYLMADDYTGFTRFASELHKDYWGMYAHKPLLRNLQEIATPLDDPGPVPVYRAQQYETSVPCAYETAPLYVGTTNIPTNLNNAANAALDLNPAIPDMEVGCTFVVH